MKTLVVDDAGFMRELLIQHCTELGHNVIAEAINGNQAVEFAKKYNPELVIMDLVLPDKNGIEASIEILKNNPNVEILAISSLEQNWIQLKTQAAGCKHFLKKPFTKNQLENTLSIIQKERRNLKHG